jgi:ribosomal protein S18 acetylase RimI-like enzyme
MLIHFTNPDIAIAGLDDLQAIKQLLDAAYRGKESLKGWTTEAHLIEGDVRTDLNSIQEVFYKEASVFLRYPATGAVLTGCVNLQKHGDKLYLGMFAVSPDKQGNGIGKQILQAADEYARQVQCRAIYMTVISVRTELINWYTRHGYSKTGELLPFPEDGIHGKHLQELQFAVLQKPLLP